MPNLAFLPSFGVVPVFDFWKACDGKMRLSWPRRRDEAVKSCVLCKARGNAPDQINRPPKAAILNGCMGMIRPLRGSPWRKLGAKARDGVTKSVGCVAMRHAPAPSVAPGFSCSAPGFSKFRPARMSHLLSSHFPILVCRPRSSTPSALRRAGVTPFPVTCMAGPTDQCLTPLRGSPRRRTLEPFAAPAMPTRVHHVQQNDHRCIAPGGDPGCGVARQSRRRV